ncbi:hypothetical protein [Arthrobacter sp. ISL-65]|uniref:hypothetical protein n=1 Tax=Arthrobacter sp. ISL-65 TaxID=2819112 RepID=UPI001BE6C7A8|nr:hypothetical protein [Arthrobacter sp. ISL-65]MBT2551335.1 hypothetical protein [Arthrobacter sp. ISL-65]
MVTLYGQNSLSKVPVSLAGATEDGVPERFVTAAVGVQIMVEAVVTVRRLVDPLVTLPRVTVTTVRGGRAWIS